MTERTMSILDHLQELRKVLLISIGSLIPASAAGWFFREQLLAILVEPVKALDQKLIYLAMTEAFMAELKIAIIAGFIIASPVIFWQVWGFILPALRTHEKRYLMVIVPLSILLFAGGVVFGYSTVFKFGIKFFLGFATDGLTPMLSLSKYLSFTFWFLLPFGLMFEMPLLIFFMAKLGIVSYPFLAKNRKFALLMVFVISAVATPTTDLISLSAMAIPMYILYEISIWIVRIIKPRAVYMEEPELENDNRQEAADTEDENRQETADTGDENRQETADTGDAADAQDSAGRLEEIYRDITDRGKPEKKEE